MSAIRGLTDYLHQNRNADGGWGYYPARRSRLEPTAWALLALSGTGPTPQASPILERWPSHNGVLLERADGGPNYGFHGLALLALQALRIDHAAGIRTLLAGLEHVKGVRLDSSTTSGRQDNTLQGWSWIPGTFSWVEPTAWCMLALKKWARTRGSDVEAARVSEAERLLVNRCCAEGGWNYGNADVLGTNLRAYVPTTAIGLLALQDRRDLEVVARSADYLERHATSERSGTALALALIALRLYGRSQNAVRSALLAQLPITLALGNHAAVALAAFALDSDRSHAAFSL